MRQKKGRSIARGIAVSWRTAEETSSQTSYHSFQHIGCNSTAKPADPPHLICIFLAYPASLPPIAGCNLDRWNKFVLVVATYTWLHCDLCQGCFPHSKIIFKLGLLSHLKASPLKKSSPAAMAVAQAYRVAPLRCCEPWPWVTICPLEVSVPLKS